MPRCILITGASNGIGAALAIHYAAEGVTLGLLGRHAERLQSIQTNCKNQGAHVITGLLDITDHLKLQHWLENFDQKNPVDLLIINAGISHAIGKKDTALMASGEPLKTIHCLLNTNVTAAINTLHAILQPMRQRGQGQIALVSSLAAYRGMPVTPAYCASKAALKAYGEALRGWLSPEGIKINVICPGFVKSSMSDHFPAPKPFMISAEKAAHLIARGLALNKAIISFPFPLNMGMWLLSVLPFPLASFFLGLSGYNRPRSEKTP